MKYSVRCPAHFSWICWVFPGIMTTFTETWICISILEDNEGHLCRVMWVSCPLRLLDLHVNSENFLVHVTLLKCLSVLFSFLISQAHYLDKIVKGTVYSLFVDISTYISLYYRVSDCSRFENRLFLMHIFVNYKSGLHYVKCLGFKVSRLQCPCLIFIILGYHKSHSYVKALVFTETKNWR